MAKGNKARQNTMVAFMKIPFFAIRQSYAAGRTELRARLCGRAALCRIPHWLRRYAGLLRHSFLRPRCVTLGTDACSVTRSSPLHCTHPREDRNAGQRVHRSATLRCAQDKGTRNAGLSFDARPYAEDDRNAE